MMRLTAALLVISTTLCTSLRLRKPMVNEDGESVIQATIGNIDGLPNESDEPVQTSKPKYTEFFDGEDAQVEEEQEARKTYKPEYKAPGPASVETSVTKGFCAQILEDIENKKAPYFVDGEFTGEMRDDLVEQCGATICSWGQEYRQLVQEHTCDACPDSCDGDFDPKAFFSQLLQNEETAKPIINAILHISKSKDGSKKMHITLSLDEDEEEDAATGIEDPDDYPLPAKEGDNGEPVVTKAFCLKVIRGIRNKEAPYYLDGGFTGECRETLKSQCGEMICGWSNVYSDLLSTESKPCSSDDRDGYLENLMQNDKGLEDMETFASADGE